MAADRRAGQRPRLSLPMLMIGLVAGCLLAVAVVARWRKVYPVEGKLVSQGDGLNNWQSRPDACSTDPQDGLPAGSSHTVVVFNWYDVTLDDPIRNWAHWLTLHDVPQRLALERTPEGLAASLTTTKTDDALVLKANACRVFSLKTQPGAPLVTGAKSSLKGTLNLDCTVSDRHITGNMTFDHCGL